MTFIRHIETTPGTYAYPTAALTGFLEQHMSLNGSMRKLKFLIKGSGIEQRHSVLEDFKDDATGRLFRKGEAAPSTAKRLAVYDEIAPKMVEDLARKAVKASGMEIQDIDAVIAVSCTGQSAPGLETDLVKRLQLPPTTERHAIHFMGCYAAFHGLRLADLICSKRPEANVLLVCIELCSLHFRDDESEDNLLSTSLFADGAAAVILSGENEQGKAKARIEGMGSAIVPDSGHVMGWNIGDEGFEMILDRSIPKRLETHIHAVYKAFLSKHRASPETVDHFAIHPGGKNILKAFQSALQLEDLSLEDSRAILKQYGNMSSPTVLFVLERLLKRAKAGERIYGAAFGPGLTVESTLIHAC